MDQAFCIRSTRVVALASFLLASACEKLPTEDSTNALSSLSTGNDVAMNESGRSNRGFEDEILRLEATVPGLGGLSLDPQSGSAVMFLSDLSKSHEALAALAAAAPRMNVTPSIRAKFSRSDRVIVKKGEVTFSRLLGFVRLIGTLDIPEVMYLDANEGMNVVDVGVLDPRAVSKTASAIVAAGVPANLIRVQVRGEGRDAINVLWNKYRPVAGGLQITAGGGACTLGFPTSVNFYNESGYLTAAHCAPPNGGGQMGAIFQPDASSSVNQIASISINPDWNRTDPECHFARCSWADVMFGVQTSGAGSFIKRVIATLDWDQHFIDNMYGGVSFGSLGWQGFAVVPYVVQGSVVYKVGRTTGVTAGIVTSTCTAYDTGGDVGPHTVLCVEFASGASVGGGDSGAPVFYPSDTTGTAPYAIGILTIGGWTSSDSDPTGKPRCTGGCFIGFSEWSAIQTHLNRYLTP